MNIDLYNEIRGIHEYDGYKSEPIWQETWEGTTFNSYDAAKQVIVPSKSLEELRREFGLNNDEKLGRVNSSVKVKKKTL